MSNGVGLDIGTSRLVCARNDGTKDVIKSFRDCYYELRGDQLDFIKEKGNWDMTIINDRYYALGDDAFKIANWIGAEVKRPMAKGILNPKDDTAIDIMGEIISKLLGPPKTEKEVCIASIPSDSVDGEVNTIFHKGALKEIISGLGYTFKPIGEGYATLLALNPTIGPDHVFTGVAISFGGGMTNLCLAFQADPKLEMAITLGGDWIDENVAKSFSNVQPNQVTSFKEQYFQFNKKYTDEEMVSFGYNNVERRNFFKKMMLCLNSVYEKHIEFTIKSFEKEFKERNINSIDDPLEIVISGGTAAPKGFEDKFAEILESEDDFPIRIKGVRKAKDPLISTATGALVRAIQYEGKRQLKNGGTSSEAKSEPEAETT